ncbi:hypothetical protein [Anabaena azotica]|uniref:Uncharacterized protein n=1 Tax=Anabaena azotica FACHB-119 TaxID=947527 RepID=A0ABR8CXL6_9NOST|nr:hypothetical protein [Anabaena azotica]MBD2499411.1 hypothetical protein [Anabaena azotica FACHB-119]
MSEARVNQFKIQKVLEIEVKKLAAKLNTYHLQFLANCLTVCQEKLKINQQHHLTWGKTGSG